MIISIDDPRMEDTYDISMPAPNHNYLANGFIVHNSWAFNRCLDGETEIRLSHAAGSHVKTIAKLYDEYEADPSHWILQQRSKPWLISLTPEGRGLPQMAVRVLRNGLRQCIDLQFDDGSSVVCTKDHRFLINDRWQPCSVAQPGDKFASLIKKIWSHGKILSEKRLVSKAKIGLRETYDIELPEHHNFMLANGLITHNSHAVAYGIVSYWCCWLKAHHPLAFAAATLDAESDPQRQIATLRELALEGVSYVPVDPSHSGERWEIANGQTLVGPLTAIKGIGPAKVREIIEARAKGGELRPALLKQLQQAKTEIDSLFPIADAVRRLHPDLAAINIFTEPTPVVRVQPGLSGDVVILALVKRIAPRDENDSIKVTKRGYKVQGPAQALNLFLADDTDEIFCKVDRFNFERLGRKIMEEGRSGKSLYAIKGQVPSDFRMIKVKAVRYLGEIDK